MQDFLRLRSDFIDEFARLEIAVGRCLQRLRISTDKKDCFDRRVEILSKAKPSPQLSKKSAANLATLAKDCEPFQRTRASLVHAVMGFGRQDEEPVALFRNVADLLSDDHICLVLNLPEFGDRIVDLRALTLRVREIATPSAPPPPRPAEAAAP